MVPLEKVWLNFPSFDVWLAHFEVWNKTAWGAIQVGFIEDVPVSTGYSCDAFV